MLFRTKTVFFSEEKIMLKQKFALMLVMLAVPFMLLSSPANAGSHCKYKHYKACYSRCYCASGMPLVYKVVRQLRAYPATADQPIYVSAVGHEVTLSGFTGTSMQKQAAIDITRYTCGVWRVVDSIRLQQP
jgi:hypothetical protein